MHPNTEKIISPWWGLILLIAAFFALYQPWLLGISDYYRQEGLFAAIAQEMNWAAPVCAAHGTVFPGYFPLFSGLGKLLTAVTGLDTVFALRLVSVFMTFATGILVIVSVWRSRNFTAAAMAGAMFWGSNIVIEKSMDAMPTTTMMFGLLSAQLCWLYAGQKRGSWSWAWGGSLAILALTFLAGGFQVVLLFFIPMIFLRRPLTLWPKLTKPGMLALPFWRQQYCCGRSRRISIPQQCRYSIGSRIGGWTDILPICGNSRWILSSAFCRG